MNSDDIIFVKYVPPPCDEEIWLIDWSEELVSDPEGEAAEMASPRTPLWSDMWEDVDDDPSEDFILSN